MSSNENRRDFLRLAAGVGAGLALGAIHESRAGAEESATPPRTGKSVVGLAAPPLDTVRVGFIGVGGRGTSLMGELLKLEGVKINAICDINPSHAAHAQEMTFKAHQNKPETYTRGDTDFKRMCDRDDLDVVFAATPWQWHAPMAVDALKKGKHAFIEVPGPVTLEECWQLVDTAEQTQKHCMMMENCCYSSSELMVLNMIRHGLLGELLYGGCAYRHDLRGILFSGTGEGTWRTQHGIERNGNLYPTHGLGPVAQYMGINRGDRFDYIVSMSTMARDMNLYAAKHFGPDDPRAKQVYKCGDVNTSLIRTVNGRTIMIDHDTFSPEPYDRINTIQGTAGMFRGYPDRIYIEGRTKNGEKWEDLSAYEKEFTHPLWQQIGETAKKDGGHGGMDFVMLWRLIHCLRNGLPLDMDVYDAAAWASVAPLSEKSVANRSASIDFPDFTRGQWKTTKPLGIVS